MIKTIKHLQREGRVGFTKNLKSGEPVFIAKNNKTPPKGGKGGI